MIVKASFQEQSTSYGIESEKKKGNILLKPAIQKSTINKSKIY